MGRTARVTTILLLACLLLPVVAACTPTPPGTPAGSAASAPTAAPAAPTAGAAANPAAAPTSVQVRDAIPTQGPLPTAPVTAVAAAKPAATPAGKRGGSIVIASTADGVTFHPYLRTDTASGSYQALVYAGSLVTYDPKTLESIPEAAKSWSVSDDKLTYTFTLRDDLLWSDGTRMTSADYKWTFDQASKPDNKYPYISNLERITSYEAPNPSTIVVKLKDPIVVGLETADAVTPLPKHIWEKLDWSDPQKNPEILAPTVGSGPYLLKEWQKDNKAVFVANDKYYDGRPLIDTVTYRIVPSSEIAYQMLKTGEVDISGFTPDNYEDAKKLPNVTVYEWWPAAASWTYLGFNMRREILKDVEMRRALSYAIDREAIAEHVLNGLARPTYSAFTPSSWVYNPDVPKYSYDPEKSKAMLDAAGWKPGPNGIRQKDGKPLKLRLIYGPNTNKTAERIATVAQQAWSDVGVQVDVQGMEWGTYLAQLRGEPFDWDVNFGAWSSTIEPHWMNQIWREDSIPSLNAGAYVSKKVEELFNQGVREFDREKRKAIYQEIQAILSTDSPYVFLTFNLSYTGVNSRIGGIEPTPVGITYNRERWYIK
ncbi:MAG: ABC transporter substrate-binding protein [Chloroflexota bacterium]